MSRLIEEDAAVERISNAIWHLPNDMYPRFNNFDTIHAVVKDAVNGVPSAQPEIVRCKDCKHGVDYYHEGDCYCSNPKWGLKYFGGSWKFYCADAERRTDG